METWEELSLSEEVRSFKRVRILSKIERARKAAFASWEDKISWNLAESDGMDTFACDVQSWAKSASAVEVGADFKAFLKEGNTLSAASFYREGENEKLGERNLAHTAERDSWLARRDSWVGRLY